MSASHRPALPVIAEQLSSALQHYDETISDMIEAWPDPERYHDVSLQIDEIRMYCSALDETRVQWVELLISHAEMIHLLWLSQYGGEPRSIALVPAAQTVRSK